MATFSNFPANGTANYEYETRLSVATNKTGCEEMDAEIEAARNEFTTLVDRITSIKETNYSVKINADDSNANYLYESISAGDHINISHDNSQITITGLLSDEFTPLTDPPALSGNLLVTCDEEIEITIVNYKAEQTYVAESSHGTPNISDNKIYMTMPSTVAGSFEDVWIRVNTTRENYTSTEGIMNMLLFPSESLIADDAISYSSFLFNKGIFFNEFHALSENSFLFSDSEIQGTTEQDWVNGYITHYIQNKEEITVEGASTTTALVLTTHKNKLFVGDNILINTGGSSKSLFQISFSNVSIQNTPTTTTLTIERENNYLKFTKGSGTWGADTGKYIHHKEKGLAKIIAVDSAIAYAEEIDTFEVNEYWNAGNIFISISAGDWYLSPLEYNCEPSLAIDTVPNKMYKINNKALFGNETENKQLQYEEQGLYPISSSINTITCGCSNNNILYANQIIAYTKNDTDDSLRHRKIYEIESVIKNEESFGTLTVSYSGTGHFWTCTLTPSGTETFTQDHVNCFIEVSGEHTGKILCVKYIDTTHMYCTIINAVYPFETLPATDWKLTSYTVTLTESVTDELIASAIPAIQYNCTSNLYIQTPKNKYIGYLPLYNKILALDTLITFQNSQETDVTVSDSNITLTNADKHTIFNIRPSDSIGSVKQNFNIYYNQSQYLEGFPDVITDSDSLRPTMFRFDPGNSEYLKRTGGSFNECYARFDKDFTIDFWVKINDLAGASGGRTLFDIYGDANNSFSMGHTDDSFIITYKKPSETDQVEISIDLRDDIWMHIALIKHHKLMNLYVNGFLLKEMSGVMQSIKYVDGNSAFYVGASGGAAPSNFFDGYMNEFRMSACARWTSEFVPNFYFNKTYAYDISFSVQDNHCVNAYKKDDELLIKEYIAANITNTNAINGFGILTWTGNSSNTQITGLSFQPDLVLIRERDAVGGYTYWFDSLRGAQNYFTDNNSTQQNDITTLVSFDSSGLNIGTSALINNTGDNYVAWCFKADQDATDASHDGEKFNMDLGISLIKYTGLGTTQQILKHSLGVKPCFAICICLTTDFTIKYYHPFMHFSPDTSTKDWGASITTSNTSPVMQNMTKDYIEIGKNGDSDFKMAGEEYLIILFAEIEGFSKFGEYIGNGSADGPSIHTDFAPQIFMAHGNNDIVVMDRTRGNSALLIGEDSNAPEDTSNYEMEFNNSGVRIKTNQAAINSSNQSYNFMAFSSSSAEYDTLQLTSDSAAFKLNTRSIAAGTKLNKNEKINNLTLNLNKVVG